jgi:AmmeMemoRadiSam system protein A
VKPAGDNNPAGPSQALGEGERKTLLELARRSLEEYFQQTVPELPTSAEDSLSRKQGCFVTLLQRGALRGCVGNVVPRLPLCQAVIQNARSAAFCDSRFPPLERNELEEILIEISVLTPPVNLQWKSVDELFRQIRPQVDGVFLQVGGQVSTFLPQVWEKLPAPVEFMNCLARKSGLSPEAWRDPSAVISVYQAECFTE